MFGDQLLNALIEKRNLATQRRQQGDQTAGSERLGFHDDLILDRNHRGGDVGDALLDTLLVTAVVLVEESPQRARMSPMQFRQSRPSFQQGARQRGPAVVQPAWK